MRGLELENLQTAAEEELRLEALEALARAKARYGLTDEEMHPQQLEQAQREADREAEYGPGCPSCWSRGFEPRTGHTCMGEAFQGCDFCVDGSD